MKKDQNNNVLHQTTLFQSSRVYMANLYIVFYIIKTEEENRCPHEDTGSSSQRMSDSTHTVHHDGKPGPGLTWYTVSCTAEVCYTRYLLASTD
ncbi:hypothetical protein E2C01_097726 [Portunus trituberculatus]|uniref:Uncharacterized protein n=1 Tax=Portunus trituberculatus TaxID=210409 RepID=A0A5B7K5K8_PORTR|nr:hypothetical protein [Portunus trituberculatus]